jgi:hypothetical protein
MKFVYCNNDNIYLSGIIAVIAFAVYWIKQRYFLGIFSSWFDNWLYSKISRLENILQSTVVQAICVADYGYHGCSIPGGILVGSYLYEAGKHSVTRRNESQRGNQVSHFPPYSKISCYKHVLRCRLHHTTNARIRWLCTEEPVITWFPCAPW